LLADEYGDKISVRIFDNSVEGYPEITLEQLEAKGIPNHEELRKRANEVLGKYDGRGLAEQSDANRATEGGGRSKVLRPIAEPSVEAPNGCKDEGRAAETVSGDAKVASDGAKGGEEKSFKIESATAEEIKGEETRRKERAGIKKRQPSVKMSRVTFKNKAEAKKAAKALPFEKWVNTRRLKIEGRSRFMVSYLGKLRKERRLSRLGDGI
jgi:hypothetical protein